MYWNETCKASTVQEQTINRNMRCIEIIFENISPDIKAQINRNMRCIEIGVHQQMDCEKDKINRNMRCIEIKVW